jgi:hypothetical protein
MELRTIAIAACGVSGGLHAALFAVHAGELPAHAAAFLTAAALLTVAGLALARRPSAREGPLAATALFAALLVAYPLAAHEPFDAVAGIALGVEGIGLLAGVALLRPRRAVAEPGIVSIFLLCVALGLMLGGGHAHG